MFSYNQDESTRKQEKKIEENDYEKNDEKVVEEEEEIEDEDDDDDEGDEDEEVKQISISPNWNQKKKDSIDWKEKMGNQPGNV